MYSNVGQFVAWIDVGRGLAMGEDWATLVATCRRPCWRKHLNSNYCRWLVSRLRCLAWLETMQWSDQCTRLTTLRCVSLHWLLFGEPHA